jgi:hypothetical protein
MAHQEFTLSNGKDGMTHFLTKPICRNYSKDELTNLMANFLIHHKKLAKLVAWRNFYRYIDPNVDRRLHKFMLIDIKDTLKYIRIIKEVLMKYISTFEFDVLVTEAVKIYIDQKSKTDSYIENKNNYFRRS